MYSSFKQGTKTKKKLVTPTEKGKETIFRVMRETDYKPYIQLLNDGFVKEDEFTINVSYHRQCYQQCIRSFSQGQTETEGAEPETEGLPELKRLHLTL